MSTTARWQVPTRMEMTGCDVFVGAMPIRLPPFSPRPLAPALARMGAIHFYTVVQRPSPGGFPYVYFDFLPESPEDPAVAFGALLGQRIPGIVQERNLRRLPTKSCWWIGKTAEDKGVESVREFNELWDKRLLLFRHDCRHYTDALVDHLTGEAGVIERVMELKRNDVDAAQRFTEYD
ncbi:hypothetical protein MPTK1_7g16440 [Marchantia polymorpha subsp. ruderalis]|uniref:Uncharacterized protein n=2 Tax=Marchantia polymorpha TaxID=3197 RepID=A0A176VK05_MARPO|nr:hypothetical protein AXG93_4010s1120 [Marchantia polymorpha subsp. ruderalis]PTQ30537.1 hypothetical protein MARPO_0123s0026 [Marchantia polymorpha]PTQ30538.1 hypothetical protein MARPO_0123s0026 [Marchantia polymorpha]PTQ30539.1 hypothetical protein MARPO_0123s0026 [Marchantia polymorpha]BBN17714.1 hypothetical protein Mp_7g16440 [Marchantia polymorpha subsp. ruderalis]|eukprot:PTQ30537.1 hypothetical protein MARPO_0123s0026 [Marchantia polymorpha]